MSSSAHLVPGERCEQGQVTCLNLLLPFITAVKVFGLRAAAKEQDVILDRRQHIQMNVQLYFGNVFLTQMQLINQDVFGYKRGRSTNLFSPQLFSPVWRLWMEQLLYQVLP